MGSEERLLLKVKHMAEDEGKKELPQRIINNEVVVTGMISAGKEEEKATNSGQESCQARTNTEDEKTAVISMGISRQEQKKIPQ